MEKKLERLVVFLLPAFFFALNFARHPLPIGDLLAWGFREFRSRYPSTARHPATSPSAQRPGANIDETRVIAISEEHLRPAAVLPDSRVYATALLRSIPKRRGWHSSRLTLFCEQRIRKE
jgi:hypothetical protein